MVRLLDIGIEVFSSMVFIVPFVFILEYIALKQHSFSRLATVMIFACYLTAVFSITGIPTITSWYMNFSFNLIPLIDIVNSPLDYIRNTILNIILFMPLGFLLPVMWKEYRSLRVVVWTGLSLSLLIELLQMFTFRLTDVDDLITNTAGTVLGYYISKLFSFRLPWRLSKKDEVHYNKYEPVIILAVSLLIGFCLKPFLSNLIWEKVLESSLWESIRN